MVEASVKENNFDDRNEIVEEKNVFSEQQSSFEDQYGEDNGPLKLRAIPFKGGGGRY